MDRTTPFDANRASQRRCGDCQLCCKLLPTPEIGSLAGDRCQHQKHGVGCAIYARRPFSCQLWSCGWLMGAEHDTLDLPRPDRAHYVIDTMPDFITIKPHDGSTPSHIGVVQVWIDPAHRDAHKAPSFRRWLDRQKAPAIIRFNERDAFVLLPPSCTEDHQWHEQTTGMREHSHTMEEKAAALGGELHITLEPEATGVGGPVYSTTLKVGDKTFAIASQAVGSKAEAQAALADARRLAAEREERKAAGKP